MRRGPIVGSLVEDGEIYPFPIACLFTKGIPISEGLKKNYFVPISARIHAFQQHKLCAERDAFSHAQLIRAQQDFLGSFKRGV